MATAEDSAWISVCNVPLPWSKFNLHLSATTNQWFNTFNKLSCNKELPSSLRCTPSWWPCGLSTMLSLSTKVILLFEHISFSILLSRWRFPWKSLWDLGIILEMKISFTPYCSLQSKPPSTRQFATFLISSVGKWYFDPNFTLKMQWNKEKNTKISCKMPKISAFRALKWVFLGFLLISVI